MGKAAWRSLHSGGLIIASTPYIAEQVGPLETHGRFAYLHRHRRMGTDPGQDVTDGPVRGWSDGGSRSRRPDLGILRGWLGPFMDEHDLRIIHAGFVEGLESWRLCPCRQHPPRSGNDRTFVPPTACPTSGLMDGVGIGLEPTPAWSARRRPHSRAWSIRRAAFRSWPARYAYRSLDGRLAGTSLADQSPSAWQAELECSGSHREAYGGCSDE